MTDADDAGLASEKVFEQARRFTDSWLLNTQHLQQSRRTKGRPVPFSSGPCQVSLSKIQQPSALDLIQSANPAFNKLAALLCYIVDVLEGFFKELETNVSPTLIIHGEEPQYFHCGNKEGDAQKWLANSISFFLEVEKLVTNLKAFTENLLIQLGSLCAEHTRKSTILQGEFARKAFLTAGEALAWLLRLETLLNKNPNIKASFAQFTSMLQTVQRTEDEFGADNTDKAKQLESEIVKMQDRLLHGRGLFRDFIEVRLGSGGPVTSACSSNAFVAAGSNLLREELTNMVDRVTVAADEMGDRSGILGCLILSAFIFRVAGSQLTWDKRLLRKLLDLHQQVPLVPIVGEHMLQPASFLSQFLPSVLDGYIPAAYARQAGVYRSQQLSTIMDEFVARVEHNSLTVAATIGTFVRLLKHAVITESLLTQTASAIVNILQLSNRIRHQLLHMLGCLKLGGVAIKRSALRKFIDAACQIKALDSALQVQSSAVSDVLPLLVSHVKSDALGLLDALTASIRAKMRSAAGNQGMLSLRGRRERTLAALQDAAVAVDGASLLAKGPVTGMQLNAIGICLEAVQTTESIPDLEITRIQKKLTILKTLCNLPYHLAQVTDCSFFYFNRHLLDASLKDLLENPHEARKLPILIQAFLDGHRLLKKTSLDVYTTHKAYDDEIQASIMNNLVTPMCDALETQLRLLYHQSQEEGRIFTTQDTEVKDFRALLQSDRIVLHTQYFHIRPIVEEELTRRLYNHTAVALHIWHTSVQLACLAKDRFGIDVQPPDLPGSDVDPGLDMMEVKQQLPSFAAGYAHSLVSQTFIQRADSQVGTKHLMTLGLPQILTALNKHGSGFSQALVDSAFKLLQRQITLLSQWMSQSALQSRLQKEAENIKGSAQISADCKYHYPFASCTELVQHLNSIGATPDGETLLDYFRRLITEIGNVMGLVRLTQLGRKANFAHTAQYTYLDSKAKLKSGGIMDELPRELGQELQRSAQNLDHAISSLRRGLHEETDWFLTLSRLVSEKEATQLRSLSNFYVMLPALTFCWVEANLLSKEQLPQRKTGDISTYFTDDGFPLGLAFLLKVCKQDEEAGSLLWFESIANHYQEEAVKLEGDRPEESSMAFVKWLGKWTNSETNSSSEQNKNLALGRLESYASEFKALGDIFNCAELLLFSKKASIEVSCPT